MRWIACVGRTVAALLALASAAAAPGAAAAAATGDLVAVGRRLYEEGRLVSGKAIEALVQGDVPVDGTQMTCRSCHGRSGMGTIEGGRIPASLAGPLLFAPEPQRRRPAYDESSLARALRDGIDAAGRPLDGLMPRFRLGDQDVAALAAYLRQLGTEPVPGLGAGSLRIATVVAGDVDGAVAAAMLDVLQAYVATRNRSGPQRLRGGHFPDQWKEPYREWTLDVWRLDGPASSWPAQMARLYAKQPVFALVGGVAAATWQPIHDFCEAKQMPCVLPVTDQPPPEEDGGFYSIYFSRGLKQEAEVVAAALASERLHGDVAVLAHAERGSQSAAAASALVRAVERRGGHVRTFDARGVADARSLRAPATGAPPSAIVLWLGLEEIRKLQPLVAAGASPPLFLSSTLLGGQWNGLPDAVRERARVVHLYALPGAADPALARFRAWARVRRIRIVNERYQALTYFACLTFAEGAKHMPIYVTRDYFLDLLEHASSLATYLPLFDHAGLTPGQRVLSRGGSLVDLSERRAPEWLAP